MKPAFLTGFTTLFLFLFCFVWMYLILDYLVLNRIFSHNKQEYIYLFYKRWNIFFQVSNISTDLNGILVSYREKYYFDNPAPSFSLELWILPNTVFPTLLERKRLHRFIKLETWETITSIPVSKFHRSKVTWNWNEIPPKWKKWFLSVASWK